MNIRKSITISGLNRSIIATLSAFAILLGSFAMVVPTFVSAEEANSGDSDKSAGPGTMLQISPVSQRTAIVAGKTYEDLVFNVTNVGSSKFSFHVYTAPYTVTDEDYNVNFTNETERTQLSRWITFKQDDGTYKDTASFTIDAGQKKEISYKISVPKDIPAGGQYATIFAESDVTEGEVTSSGIQTVSRVGMIIYGSTDGDTINSAEILEYNIPTFLTSGNISATSKIRNSGNTDFEASYNFTVKSLFGRTLYEKATSYPVLPDTERRVSLEWENTPMMGFFQVQYTINALDKTQEVSRIVVIIPPFVMVIGLILLTLIIVWIIILIRKRRERRSRLLV